MCRVIRNHIYLQKKNILNFCYQIVGSTNKTNRDFVTSSKENKIKLNEVIEKELYKTVEVKIGTNNVAALYNFSQLYSSSNASKPPLQFIERCFQMFVDCTSFLELDLKLISKILSSSELNIDSEMEVFNAVVSWLEYKKERKIYAKDLFLKVRLCFLSDPALKLIKEKISCLIDDFAFINEVITEKKKYLTQKT